MSLPLCASGSRGGNVKTAQGERGFSLLRFDLVHDGGEEIMRNRSGVSIAIKLDDSCCSAYLPNPMNSRFKCCNAYNVHLYTSLPSVPLGHQIRIQRRQIYHFFARPTRIGMPHKPRFPTRSPSETRCRDLARGGWWREQRICICRVGDAESAGVGDWCRGRGGKFRRGWIRGEVVSACGRCSGCGDGIGFRLRLFAFCS
jgi:hypothetical protein